MGIKQTLKRGRRHSERLMTDTVIVSRRSSVPVTDPETHEVSYPTETIYEGSGRIQSRNTEGKDFTDAGAAVLIVAFQAQVPVSVPLQQNDLIEVTASESDPLMVGRVFRVDSVQRKTHATKTEANVEEATS
mgnify:CR=1 FL=1